MFVNWFVVSSECVIAVFQFVVVAYNPFGHNVSTWIRVPVSGKSYAVSDYQLHSVSAQVCCCQCFRQFISFISLLFNS